MFLMEQDDMNQTEHQKWMNSLMRGFAKIEPEQTYRAFHAFMGDYGAETMEAWPMLYALGTEGIKGAIQAKEYGIACRFFDQTATLGEYVLENPDRVTSWTYNKDDLLRQQEAILALGCHLMHEMGGERLADPVDATLDPAGIRAACKKIASKILFPMN